MPHRRWLLGCALLIPLLATCRVSLAQTLQAGPQVLTFFSDVDDSDQPYGLYLPKGYDPSRKYPLVIMLHGAGSNHRLALRRVFGQSNREGETDVEATRYFPEWRDVDYIVAAPLARGTMGYQGIAEKDVLDVLAEVKRRFSIDEDRVYLTGLSMGGGGTLWLGLTRPDLWAAIAPVCPGLMSDIDELLPNALNIPVHLFQGGADPVVKPEGTRDLVEQFKKLGTKVEYDEYPGVGHNSWENAYKDEAIFTWFAQFRRDRYPDRVRFATRWYKYNSAYWVRIDELTPGTLAKIDAKFAAPNQIEIVTSALDGFTLHLAGHPKFDASKPLRLTLNGKTIEATARDWLALSRRDDTWSISQAATVAGAKRAGAEGPMREAVAARHLYVYGTADSPSPDELAQRREQAARAANWSMRLDWSSPMAGFFAQVRPLAVFFRVVADKDVRPSDLESSNLVLFGTKETNRLIAKFSDRLPLQLNSAASGYGLVYIFPIEGHYVLINSGSPWWAPTEAPSASVGQRSRGRFLNWPAALLADHKDYLLFKDAPEDPIVDGYFDRQWRVPAAIAKKLEDTGAVTVTSAKGVAAIPTR
jgi:predicted esterase